MLLETCTENNKIAPGSEGGEKAGMEVDEDTFDTSTLPLFTELLLRMIEELSDDVVSWSIAGDSFIIKQARRERGADNARST